MAAETQLDDFESLLCVRMRRKNGDEEPGAFKGKHLIFDAFSFYFMLPACKEGRRQVVLPWTNPYTNRM